MKLKILYLFPHHLNIYGDRGNILTLLYRAKKRRIETEVVEVNSCHDKIPQDVNLIFGGGGQDKQQEYVSGELQFFKKEIHELIFDKKIPALTICGTYQLFGHYFKTFNGKEIKGISVFDLITIASNVRKIGNVVIKLNDVFDEHRLIADEDTHHNNLVVGFENHSGNTYLNQKSKIKNQNYNSKCKNIRVNPFQISVNPRLWNNEKQINQENIQPLGKILRGCGNNGQDGTEGAIVENCIGTYLHGPLLPKNPQLADWLIRNALIGGQIQRSVPTTKNNSVGDDFYIVPSLKCIDDTLELQTREKVIKYLT